MLGADAMRRRGAPESDEAFRVAKTDLELANVPERADPQHPVPDRGDSEQVLRDVTLQVHLDSLEGDKLEGGRGGMMRTIGLGVAAALLVVCGCATLDSTLKSTIGQPIDGAIIANGAPTQSFDLPSGGKAYTWVQHRGPIECWITLATDPQGVVRSYSYRNCP